MRVLVEVGEICADYQDKVFRNLRCKRLQLDEIWALDLLQGKNRTEEIARNNPDAGDVWLWVCHRCRHQVGSILAAWAARLSDGDRLRE